MKRSARDVELEMVAHDAVALVHQEQAALGDLILHTFFSTPEALLEAMQDRPLLLVKLMQTNKAMYAFWNRVPRLWVALHDRMLYNWNRDHPEWTAIWLAVYPYFMIQNRREHAQRIEVHQAIDWGAPSDYQPAGLLFLKHATRDANRSAVALSHMVSHHNGSYTAPIVVLTSPLVIALYNKLRRMSTALLSATDVMYYELSMLSLNERYLALGDVILVRRVRFDGDTTNFNDADFRGIYGDYSDMPPPSPSTVLERIANDVARVIRSLDKIDAEYRLRPPLPGYMTVQAAVFPVLRRLADELQFVITESARLGMVDGGIQLLVLNAETARPYRDVLWNDVYNTPEAQRRQMLRVVRASVVSGGVQSSELGVPLRCMTCVRATEHVDTHQMLPFCTDALCASLYAQCSINDDTTVAQ